MEAQAALQTFLSGALLRKRDRYLGFVAKPKTRSRFLRTIDHDLERELDGALRIAHLPVDRPIKGFRFAPPDEFGSPVSDLRQLLQSCDDSFLAVSEDGQYGVLSPETYIDDRAVYRLRGDQNHGSNSG